MNKGEGVLGQGPGQEGGGAGGVGEASKLAHHSCADLPSGAKQVFGSLTPDGPSECKISLPNAFVKSPPRAIHADCMQQQSTAHMMQVYVSKLT